MSVQSKSTVCKDLYWMKRNSALLLKKCKKIYNIDIYIYIWGRVARIPPIMVRAMLRRGLLWGTGWPHAVPRPGPPLWCGGGFCVV